MDYGSRGYWFNVVGVVFDQIRTILKWIVDNKPTQTDKYYTSKVNKLTVTQIKDISLHMKKWFILISDIT